MKYLPSKKKQTKGSKRLDTSFSKKSGVGPRPSGSAIKHPILDWRCKIYYAQKKFWCQSDPDQGTVTFVSLYSTPLCKISFSFL